jgi:PHD/YefM family antitoxin component YafN of YafNO toxin-antitoxin module
MHEEVITTTSSSKFSNVNSTHDGTVTVSIVHPQHIEYIASSDCSTLTTSQIIPSQSSSDLSTLKDDVSSVIMNGALTNSNDPNVLILPPETCDSDKDTLTLGNLQADQVELDLHDSVNDETSSREEGEQSFREESSLCC